MTMTQLDQSVVPTARARILTLLSQAFRNNSAIPYQYTCKGQGVNPPLTILDVPHDARSLALIMHDPDAVSGDFTHWLMWDIPASNESISVNKVPVGAVQGKNGAGKNKYTGPCPPAGTGTHHYMFELYALDKTLGLPAGSDRHQLEQSLENHVLAKSTLIGLFAG